MSKIPRTDKKKSPKEKIPFEDDYNSIEDILEEEVTSPHKIFINKPSIALLDARLPGYPNESHPVEFPFLKQEDIETECEDSEDSFTNSCDQSHSFASRDDLQKDIIECHANASSNAIPLDTITNVCNIGIKEESKDLGYDKYDIGRCEMNSNSNQQHEPIPSDSLAQSVHLNEMNQVSTASTLIRIKTESLDTSNSSRLVVENPIYSYGTHNANISDEIISKMTDRWILAATSGANCVVHHRKNDAANNNSSHETHHSNIYGEITSKLNDQWISAATARHSCPVHHKENDVVKNNSSHECSPAGQRTTEEIFFNVNKESKINKKIKTEPEDIQSNKSENKSASEVPNSSNYCSSGNIQQSFPPKYFRKTSNLESEPFSDDESCKFSTDSMRYLYLNMDITKQNITKCLDYLISKYSSTNVFELFDCKENQGEQTPESSATDCLQNVSNTFLHNYSSPQKPALEIERIPIMNRSDVNRTPSDNNYSLQKHKLEINKEMTTVQEVNCFEIQTTHSLYSTGDITAVQNKNSFSQSTSVSAADILTNYLQNIKTEPEDIKKKKEETNQDSIVNLPKTHAPIQYSEQSYFKNENLITEKTKSYLHESEKGDTECSNLTLPSLEMRQLEGICQKSGMLNSSISEGPHINKQVIMKEEYTETVNVNSEPPLKKIKLENRSYNINCQASACSDQTVCNDKYNSQVNSSSFGSVSSKSPILNMKQKSHNPRKKTEEYIHRSVTRDPRLQKGVPLYDDDHVRLHSVTTQMSKSTNSSNTRPHNVKKIVQHNHTKQASQFLTSVSPEVTSYNHESTSRNLDHLSGESFSRVHRTVPRIRCNTVRRAVATKELFLHIIAWNTRWLHMQKDTTECPKLIRECKNVKDNYKNFVEYQDTYHCLHLLNIWLRMYESWKKNPPCYEAQLSECEIKRHHYKNSCIAVMHSEDIPMHQCIIEIKCTNVYNKLQCLLGYVCEVRAREHPPPNGSHRSGSWKQVIFSFYTIDKLDIKIKDTFEFYKLIKIRVAVSQYDALSAMESHPMRDVIINPRHHSGEIKLVSLPFTYSQNVMQTHIDEIVECATSLENKFTLVIKESTVDTLLPILKIIRGLLNRRSTILICLLDIKRFFSLAELLNSPGSPEIVLGVKESEINVPVPLQEFTLRSHAAKLSKMSLDKAELEVLRNGRIILTVLSNVFLSDSRNAILGPDLTCIIEDAHLCTEAETALPLSLKPKNVVLLGIRKGHLKMNSILKSFGYHRSLFKRLYKIKTKN